MEDPQTIDWNERVEQLRRRVEERRADEPSPVGTGGVVEVEPSEAEAHERRWRRIIPARYVDARTEQLSGELARAREWDGQSNVLLLGNVGSGKTHAAVALSRMTHDAGGTVLFRNALALIDDLKPGDRADEWMHRALTADLLIVDDLGYERRTDFAADRMSRVLIDRYDECRPTVVTSNLGPEALEDAVGPRIFSRLYHGALRLKVAGEDRRKGAA